MLRKILSLSAIAVLVIGSLAVAGSLVITDHPRGQGTGQGAQGGGKGSNNIFEPLQGQAGTTLSAFKTAEGFLERQIVYDWDVDKSVSPTSIEIPKSSTGTVTYTIDVTRTEVSDTLVAGVRGDICVTNGGDVATENLKLVDQVEFKTGPGPFQALPGATQTIIPSTQLGPGETQCYPYEVTFTPVPGAQYRNSAKVTITNHSGHLGNEFGPEPKADFSLPSEPTVVEIDKDATLSDVQTCPNGFTCTPSETGPWDLIGQEPNNKDEATIQFTKTIKNVSVECGKHATLLNTAILVEGDTGEQRTDSATVSIFTGECPPIEEPPVDDNGARTMGFWRNHESATTALLPQMLGNHNVDTFAKAKAIFDSANSKNAHDMLAAQLLAAKLNIANGVDGSCVSTSITTADNILINAGYSGPGSTTAPKGQDKKAVDMVKNELDSFNNFGCP